MKAWRVILNGVDITRKVSRVQTRFEAENISGEVSVDIADRAVLDGIVLPRVPQGLSIAVDALVNGAWASRGAYFLDEITFPKNPAALTAAVWGRTLSARLYVPWGQKISRQWPAATTIAEILQELAAMCGVTIQVQNDYPICQYCYAVSDWYPSQIIQDLAEKSGQICWPQVDGSLIVAPRLYRNLPAPDVTLVAKEIDVQGVRRQVPEFGNRILVSGDGAVAGLSVTVVPLADDDACVVADGTSSVRLIAIVLGVDGSPVALGTTVTWSASAGLMSAETSQTGHVMRQGEVHQADSYTRVTLDLPAVSVVGVYARKDTRRVTNLYRQRSGDVSGRVITFSSPLDYYDQTVIVDYIVAGAPITWQAGWVPGDVTVLGSVAGAQGFCTLHQSNPTACSTQLVLEAVPTSPCLGEAVTIFLKTIMFGGAGIGSAVFGLAGCGSLSSTRKTLSPRQITETLRTSTWGGAAEVKLSAVPVAGTTPIIYAVGTTAPNLYASHAGQTVILNDASILPGTQVAATYVAGGTAMVTWVPSALPSGNESVSEALKVAHVEVEGVTVGQVTLSRTPVSTISAVPLGEISSAYASHVGKVVTLENDSFTGLPFPVDSTVHCSYQTVWGVQPGCSATITVRVEDGSEDGGFGQIAVSARDCRTVNPGETYDPEDPDQIPDETTDPDEDGDGDPIDPPDLDDEEDLTVTPTGCNTGSINARTPVINAQNSTSVFGVPDVENCPGNCTCDEICTALRNTGRLSVEGSMTWSTCMTACNAARAQQCQSCTLSGPSTLEPGAEGTWTDNKGNAGEWKGGGVDLIERTPAGYKAKMPSGGAGPFTVQVCYGKDARQCCEKQVNFPPCSLTGPSKLSAGQEGEFVPSLGMSAASATVTNMEIVRQTATAFVAKLKEGKCTGSINVFYGVRLCGSKTVTDSYAETVGVVTGPSALAPGETAYFAHSLGDGASYAGTLTVISSGPGGAILQMPDGATGSRTAAWGGRCGVTASMTVEAQDPVSCTGYSSKECFSGVGDVGRCWDGVVREIGGAITGVLPVDPEYRPSGCEWFWNGGGFFDHYFDDSHAQRHAGVVICS